MSKEDKKNRKFTNPIDKDNISEAPHNLTYGHHRGSLPVIPTKEGDIKNKSIAAMEHQTDIQLLQIKEQMELLAKQANHLKSRVEISQSIYNAEIRFEPIISHIYHLYQSDDAKYLLSMIAPNDWGKKNCPYQFIATVKLLADHTWEIIKKS